MLVLALETSHLPGSIALVDVDRTIHQAEIPSSGKTAQTLLPALSQLLTEADVSPQQVDLVAVSHGPGSFTGLRIGVTCAKTFAFAAAAEVLGVDTLRVCAAQAGAGTIEAVINAQRSELFLARYLSEGQSPHMVVEPRIVSSDTWLQGLSPDVLYTGPGLSRIESRLAADVSLAPAEAWMPQAATVARLALADYAAGVRHSIWTLVPQYFRQSAADEKRLSAGQQ